MAAKMAGKMPHVPFGYNLYVEAFFNLCTERPAVQGATLSIPISKIYWLAEQLEVSDVDTFIRLILSMDREFVKAIGIQQKKQESAKSK